MGTLGGLAVWFVTSVNMQALPEYKVVRKHDRELDKELDRFGVKLPSSAAGVEYVDETTWDTNSTTVTFYASAGDVASFIQSLGGNRAEFEPGVNPLADYVAVKRAGWEFGRDADLLSKSFWGLNAGDYFVVVVEATGRANQVVYFCASR